MVFNSIFATHFLTPQNLLCACVPGNGGGGNRMFWCKYVSTHATNDHAHTHMSVSKIDPDKSKDTYVHKWCSNNKRELY